jgi:glycosyltransferase involved in cell wall biosynthesis
MERTDLQTDNEKRPMKKKSILVISHEFPPLGGGAGRSLQSLCDELYKRGYSFHLITEKPSGCQSAGHPFPITFVPCFRRSDFQTSFFSTVVFLVGALRAGIFKKKASIDFVFSNMAIPAGIAGSIIAAMHRRPHIVWHHGSDVHAGRTLGAPLIQKLMLKAIWKRSFANCFVSESLLARARTYGSVPKVYIVPVAPVIKSRLLMNTEPGQNLLMLARMENVKNPLLLIEACKLLKKRGDMNHKILLVGDGSLFGPVNDRIAAYGLDNAVSLRKNVSHDRVAEVLSSAYALVLPSVIEGLNISMLEAALLSVPTIGSDVPGINDFVKHKSTGLLFRGNDPEGLAAQMQELDKDPGMRQTLGKNACEAAKRYTMQATCDKMENLFRGES